MTPERAKELAEANGCTLKPFIGGGGYWVTRPWKERGRISRLLWPDALAAMSEADFIANLPDKRD